MKNITLLIISLVIYGCSNNNSNEISNQEEYPENIYNGDANLKTQIEVDNFGSNNYTSIIGNLFVGKADSDIYNLNALESLSNVSKSISIRYTQVNNLFGLNNVIECSGLQIQGNQNLTTIEHLSGLSFIENSSNLKNLNISSNQNLVNLNGLENITHAFEVIITNNESLTNIDALNNLTNINWKIRISSNNSLNNVNGLSNLIAIGNSNGILTNNTFLGNLYLTNSVSILYNQNLATIEFNNLINTGSGIEIIGNQSLQTVNFSSLNELANSNPSQIPESINSLDIQINPSLNNLFLDELDYLGWGNIFISENNSLEIITANNLTNIPSSNINGFYSLTIRENNNLENFSFENLQTIKSSLVIGNNESLISFNLNTLRSLNRIFIINNNSLLHLDGLTNLNDMTGNDFNSYNIENNNVLRDFCGIHSLLTDIQDIWPVNFDGMQYFQTLFGTKTLQAVINGDCIF